MALIQWVKHYPGLAVMSIGTAMDATVQTTCFAGKACQTGSVTVTFQASQDTCIVNKHTDKLCVKHIVIGL